MAPEKQIALEMQMLVWKALADLGHTVLPTRVEDVFVELGARAAYANKHRADAFVSLHGNASGSSSVRGPWTIHSKGSARGQELAFCVQRELARAAGGNVRSVYPDESGWVGGRRLAVLRQTAMPAALIELGFMTNANESRQLMDPAYRRRLAAAIAAGVHAWRP